MHGGGQKEQTDPQTYQHNNPVWFAYRVWSHRNMTQSISKPWKPCWVAELWGWRRIKTLENRNWGNPKWLIWKKNDTWFSSRNNRLEWRNGMKEKRGGKDKTSVSEEWYDKGPVKDRWLEKSQIGRTLIQTANHKAKAGLPRWKPENPRLRRSYNGGKATLILTHEKARGLGGIVGF